MNIEMNNIAGIVDGAATIQPGINTVQASNWQGKSSFIQAIETAFGTRKSLTEGKDVGRVAFEIEGEGHEVRLERSNGSVVRRGNPILADEYDQLLADLFAFLGEQNEIRRAVRNGDNLKELLIKPLEVDNIDERIADLRNERESVKTELVKAREKKSELVSLKQRKNNIKSQISDLHDQRDEFDSSIESDSREKLSELRAERDRVIDLIDRLETTLERSREKLTEIHAEYESIEVEDSAKIESEIAEVRDQYEQTKEDREILQSVYSANKRLLEEGRLELLSDIDRGLVEDSYTCWLCTGETTVEEMETQLDAVGEKVLDLREEVSTYERRIEELEAERDEIRSQKQRKADLESRVTELESTISERDENLSSAEERLETIESQIDELEETVDGADRELSEIQSEIKYKEAELEDLEAEIEAASTAADRIEMLEEEEETLEAEILELRERKETMQTRLRTSFDESITSIVSLFETSFESARLTSEFELVVARDGQEVSLDALSEGEVELLGLITAIAGFEAYDVAEKTPLILLDQLGGLADDNLVTLADYLEDRTESLVLTVYPENSLFGKHQINPADWEVIQAAEAPRA